MDNTVTESSVRQPLIRFSDLPKNAPFSGTITSIRSGETMSGIFVKVGGTDALLIESAHDREPQTRGEFVEEPPYGRFIRPECVVLILSIDDGKLPDGRLPILLDNLVVRDLKFVDVRIAVLN
jgi:hypothetical protein